MGLVASFQGTRIYINQFDHAPPHVHVYKGEYQAVVDIVTLQEMGGKLPRKTLMSVRAWMNEHREALLALWQSAEQGNGFDPIEVRDR